jgi:Family of unknown function (DUF6338)
MRPMPPATGPALIILVAFLLPGFVTVLLQELTFKRPDDPTPLDRLLRIVCYSVWSYLIISVVAIVFGVNKANFLPWYHAHTGNPALLVLLGVALVLVPSIVIVVVTRLWSGSGFRKRVLELLRVNIRHTEPTAWDFFFRQHRNAYVRVKFATGAQVVGYYGADSFAAYAKDGRDLYLEEAHEWDQEADWIGNAVPATAGVWINAAEAVAVEFYTGGEHGEEAKQDTPATTPEDGQEGRPRGSKAAGEAAAAEESVGQRK